MREFTELTIWRNTYAGQLEETAQLIWPEHRNTFFYGTFNWPGMKKTQQQVDASGMLALHRFAAITDSLLTPADTLVVGWENEFPTAARAAARKYVRKRQVLQWAFAGAPGHPALRAACEMSLEERIARFEPMLQHLKVYDVHRWRDDFIHALTPDNALAMSA